MKSFNILIIALLSFTSTFSQENKEKISRENNPKIDSLVKIDFLSYKYKYLDKNFKIKIPKEVYEKTFVAYHFIPEKTKTYKDSLSVVLMAEFKDWDAQRIASLRINYTWQRLSYYLWMNEKEVLDLAKKLKIKMPYRLKELFVANDPKVKSEVLNLKNKLYLKFGNEDIKKMSGDELLNFAFKQNPEIMKDRNKHSLDSIKK